MRARATSGTVRGPRCAPSCAASSTRCRSRSAGRAATGAARSTVPPMRCGRHPPEVSTQAGFGALLNEIASEDAARRAHRHHLAGRHRVDQSRRLGEPARPVRARERSPIRFKSERIPSTFNWEFSPKGQHIELGIAEMNLFILLSALGLSHRSTASGCCRSARCTIRSSRAVSMRSTTPATRTPASSWWRRRPASRSRRRAARTSRSERR
jgi:hypothetical protein